jgi:homocysteine S-methyltransferase
LSPVVLTDGGLETSLIFEQGFDLPCFASFPLLETDAGRQGLSRYFTPFLDLAEEHGVPFVLDTATWRANPDWGEQLGYTNERLAQVNREAVAFAKDLAEGRSEVTINGALGPRGDGYVIADRMDEDDAERYHAWQIEALREGGAEQVSGITLTYPEEAVGVVRAAVDVELPVVIGFTVETDGRLPSGDRLADAIALVEERTGGAATSFMINCAHPSHLAPALAEGGSELERIGGLRANASARSHAELDESTELDEGVPEALAAEYCALRTQLPALELLGGCCGTDHRHVRAIVEAWTDSA